MTGEILWSAAEFEAGVDSFDRGAFYDAHEIWEHLWLRIDGQDRLFLQALIQASVALHHFSRGNGTGAWTLSRAVVAKLAVLPPCHRGLDLDGFAAAFEVWLSPLAEAVKRGSREARPPVGSMPPKLGPFRRRVDPN